MKKIGSRISVCSSSLIRGALLASVYADAQALQVNDGNQMLTISTGIAGGQHVSVTNASHSLRTIANADSTDHGVDFVSKPEL